MTPNILNILLNFVESVAQVPEAIITDIEMVRSIFDCKVPGHRIHNIQMRHNRPTQVSPVWAICVLMST